MNNIETAISQLLRDKPFYAHFFLGAVQDYDSKKISTAGVGFFNNKINFVWNKSFLSELAPSEVKFVIQHEIAHVMFEHIYYDYKGNKINKSNANIAQDCAINQIIDGTVPKKAVTLVSLSKTLGKNLLAKQSWLYYYNEIEDFAKKNPDKCMPDFSYDSHDWGDGDGSGESKETKEDMALKKAALKHAIDQAVKQSKGVVPQEVLQLDLS